MPLQFVWQPTDDDICRRDRLARLTFQQKLKQLKAIAPKQYAAAEILVGEALLRHWSKFPETVSSSRSTRKTGRPARAAGGG